MAIASWFFFACFAACEKAGPEARVPCKLRGKYGYCDALGRETLSPRFDGADTFSEGRARVLSDGRFGFIDSSGAWVVSPRFRHAFPFRGGSALVRTDQGFDFIDRNGRLLGSPRISANSQDL
jgi:hypothetical protein